MGTIFLKPRMVCELLQPPPIRTFASKALGIFVLWYVLYELWLLPDGRLDHWVALKVIYGAAFLTKIKGFEVWMQGRVVTIAGNNGIEMVDGCTLISAIGLFLGFIWTYPGQNRSRFYFSLMGIATMFLFAGLSLHPNWWIGYDLITVYLLPLASMALVAIRYAQQLTIPSH